MAIYITGDIHGKIDRFKQNKFTAEDIVIVCGDFGMPWNNDEESERNLAWLAEQPYQVLYIDGNHEDYDLLNLYPKTQLYGGTVHKLADNIYHLMRGEIYTIEDKPFFCFGGATSVDRWWRIEHESWWREENYTFLEARKALENLDKYGWDVDYVLTHTAPLKFSNLLVGDKQHLEPCPTADFLSELEPKIKRKMWCFGHFHMDEELERAKAVYRNVVQL